MLLGILQTGLCNHAWENDSSLDRLIVSGPFTLSTPGHFIKGTNLPA